MAKKVIVGGRIESKEVGGIVTGAAEILDDTKGKKQNVINQETDAELERLDGAKQDVLSFDNTPTEGSNNPVKSGGVYAADKALSDAIEAILLLIPSAASALNKLVDQATMNSSISTATATFRGTYNVVTDLELTVDATHEQIAAKLAQVVSEADNNDYAFVQVPVSAESTDIRRTERYKFNGTAWAYEYDLNTSGFTAAQWAAINSGITLALVAKLSGLPTSSELMALLGQKQDTLTFDNIPTSGSNNPVKSGGVYSAINDEKTAREQLAQSVAGINGRLGNVEEVIPAGAAANNKLVANSSMESYVASIIDAITASFTIATADGHINLTLTQTNGRVASLTLTSYDIASAQALTALTGRVSTAEGNITTINGNITTLGGRVSTNETDIANLQQLYNDLQQSKPVPVTALPSTGQQQGVIYRLAGTTSYSDYMWNGSTWVLMATYNNAIDNVPTAGSDNLVKSSGIQQYCTIIQDIFYNKALNISYNLIEANGWFVTDYVDVSGISVLEVNFGASPNLTYCACAYDANKAPVDFFSNDSPVRDINVPANTKYFRFSFYHRGNYYAKNKSNNNLVYTNVLLPVQEVYADLIIKNGNDFGVLDFNVATYNVCKYFMFDYTEEQKTQYRNKIFPEYVNQMKSLFVFTQEDNIYGNVNREFWGNFFKYSYTPEDWWCGIYSKLPLIKTGVLELSPLHDWSDEYGYPDAYPRKYTWATTYINGKEVLLVSLHGGISSAQSREEEFQQLITFCDDYDYVIMGGDTNHNAGGTSDTIFEILHNAGYQTSNYGFWGGIDTYEINTQYAEKIDSIITKGFNLNSMDVISASIAWPDHHPVVSNINMEI